MAVKGIRSLSISTLSNNVTTPTLVDIPVPSVSITNKPSTGTSLYHTCRSVLDQLSLVEGMSCYLESDMDPLNKLWGLCRKGAPLATLFNSLTSVEPLKFELHESYQLNDCKKIVYHFIVACRDQLIFTEDDLFTLSDLYQDNTNGFVKVINTINLILNLLEEKGIITCQNSTNRNSYNEPKDTRDKVVNELLETERKYVQDLEILQNYMRELQIQEILNPDTIHYLFGNLNTLVDFQRRFLIQLEEIGERQAEEQDFGSLFKHQEEQFTVYEPYCSNYFSAQHLVKQESPKLQKLADILNPEYELPSMLIKPVQRICKYPLLLHQLMKATQPDWPHVGDLEEGLEAIKRVTEKVNETQRIHDNQLIVEDLKKRLSEPRSLERYGTLLLHEKLGVRREEDPERELQVFLFERVVLICKESKEAKHKSNIAIKKKRRGSLEARICISLSQLVAIHHFENRCLQLEWRDPETGPLCLRFRNEELLTLWDSTLKRIQPDENESRVRSNSLSAHLIQSLSSHRPKIPRNMSTDQGSTYINRAIPRSTSSSNMQHLDFHYPVSPPPSIPSSPTHRVTASEEEEAHWQRLYGPRAFFPSTRLRSQSNPNIPVQNHQKHWDANLPYLPQLQTPPAESPGRLTAPSSPYLPGTVKVKLNYDDGIYVIVCNTEVLYHELIEKVDRKIRLVSNLPHHENLRLKYEDEDGDLITINSDDDVQMAFESRGNLNTINLFVSVSH